MKFRRPAVNAVAVFAATAIPVAVITGLIVANTGSTETATKASVVAEVTTTTSTVEIATSTTEAPVVTTTTAAPELSEAAVAEQGEVSSWKRASISQCGCSVEFPGPISQSSASLPDGRPAHLVLSQAAGSPISSALWTTTATPDADRAEELTTVLNTIAAGAKLVDQASDADRARATMVDGATRAKIDVRSVGDKIVVLFIASNNGEGLDAASARYSTSLRF